MPSPFPGMDPYLEGSLWSSVQTQLSAEIARQLAPKLRPQYLALTADMQSAVPHVTVEVRDAANRQLVTAIEVLSPTDKRGDGYDEYLAKRRRILLSTAHLLEIDLLRSGKRLPMQTPLPDAAYFVFLSRAEQRPLTDVWPIQLRERLPGVPVPLLPGDGEVELDLRTALTNVYDLLSYDLAVDYTQLPEIRLPAAEAEWADTLLRTASIHQRK